MFIGNAYWGMSNHIIEHIFPEFKILILYVFFAASNRWNHSKVGIFFHSQIKSLFSHKEDFKVKFLICSDDFWEYSVASKSIFVFDDDDDDSVSSPLDL